MLACPICRAATILLGTKTGRWSGRRFDIRRCPECAFTFVAAPWTDFAEIYGDDYYAGRGADPLVDYVHELDHPSSTIRRHEWRGIHAAVRRLTGDGNGLRWLDYGCGTGGLVLHLRGHGVDAVGFEEGWSLPRLQQRGVPVLDPDGLRAAAGTFDVLTAIEVVEHVPDPVALLTDMARLLRPGGLLFVTTGNAAPHRDRILEWPYLIPEIHISLFEPDTLARAMREAGLDVEFPGWGAGWSDIVRFKVLKNLRCQDVSPFERAVPWPLLGRILDRRLRLAAHPVGRARLRSAADA